MNPLANAVDRRTALRMLAGGAALMGVGASFAPPGRASAAPSDWLPVPTGSGRRYHVSPGGDDGNDGLNPGTPFRTIQRAVDRTEPGDTVYLMDGVHTNRPDTRTAEERARRPVTEGPAGAANACSFTRSGTADAWIHLTAFPGHRPEIRVDETAFEGILCAGAAYILVSGLILTGNSRNPGYDYQDAFANQSRAVPKYNCNGITARINFDTRQTPHHFMVRNCLVRLWPGGGVNSAECDYTTIENNTIHSNAWYSVYANSGTTVIRPVNSDRNPGYHNVVRNNYVWDNRGYIPWDRGNGSPKVLSDGNGIIVDTTTKQFTDTGVPYAGLTLVCSNIAAFNGGSGVHAFESENVHIIGNTGYLNSATTGLDGYASIGAWYCRDTVVANNVSHVRPGKPSTINSRNTNVSYRHNCYFGGVPPVAGTSGPTDLVGVDPLLVNPKIGSGNPAGDFGLQPSSPCIDAGTAEFVPVVGTDFTRRPWRAPVDLGAVQAR